jgi:uncharacterized protein YbjQ (UPF0145 family)
MSEPDQDQAQEREQAESLARIEAGGIPLSAERRLSELSERGGSFTSDLSVNGFALCHQLGLTPLSQVMGSSIYQMGYQGAWGATSFGGSALVELDSLSQALNEVRGRALNRLAEEARHVGADAVVGVETRAGESDLGGGGGQLALEQMVLGTAVRRKDRSSGIAQRTEHPVMTELSVADYALLLRAGIEPAGIVAWSSVFFASYAYSGMLGGGPGMMSSMQPYELSEFTQALYSARERTMGQITQQASALGASGVVGVRIGHTIQPRTLNAGMGGAIGGFGGRELRGMMITFNAIGTAIHQHADAEIQAPEPVVDLFA